MTTSRARADQVTPYTATLYTYYNYYTYYKVIIYASLAWFSVLNQVDSNVRLLSVTMYQF